LEFGDRLKDFRLKRKLSLDGLSRKSGVSKGMLSHIERNISVPTIATLQKIAGGFGVPLSTFLPEKEEDSSAAQDGLVNSKDVFLVRKDRRKKLIMPTGDWFEMLCPDLRHRIELIDLHYPVGGVSGETYSHEGEECGVLLEGRVKGIIGDQTVILDAGWMRGIPSTTKAPFPIAGRTSATLKQGLSGRLRLPHSSPNYS
jgi:transcriptional regulator with XRE-family HTH domain